MYGSVPGTKPGAAIAGVAATQLPRTGADLLLLGMVAVLLLFCGFVSLRIAARKAHA